ncbi:MAG TPA: aminoglycoside phosphotransferase family protein [Gemmatimonadaceae bacterium]|jgi:aminoglycoside phosphotransferase (APT) family kinase protein
MSGLLGGIKALKDTLHTWGKRMVPLFYGRNRSAEPYTATILDELERQGYGCAREANPSAVQRRVSRFSDPSDSGSQRNSPTPRSKVSDPESSIHSSPPEESYVPPEPMAPEKAAALITSSFREVDTTPVRHIGSGTMFDAFRTSDDWVFRFPRWDWCGDLFEAEARIHQFVAKVLPARIRLPRVQLLAEPTERFPYAFAGHRFVPGIGADAVDEALMPTVAREIAEFLGVLHSTPGAVAEAAGFREITIDEAGRREWYEHGLAVSAQLRGLDPVIDDAIDWLRAAPVPSPAFGPRQLIHSDLAPEHLLVDPATGTLLGVIDWTDGSIGDAARDFVSLVTWRGWRFAEEVLALYPRRVDGEFRSRLRYMAQWLSVLWLAFAPEQGRDLEKDIAGVHNAFAPNAFQPSV